MVLVRNKQVGTGSKYERQHWQKYNEKVKRKVALTR